LQSRDDGKLMLDDKNISLKIKLKEDNQRCFFRTLISRPTYRWNPSPFKLNSTLLSSLHDESVLSIN